MITIAFFGGDSKVGTTTLAQSAAEAFAEDREKQVMLIHCRSSWGMQYIGECRETLEKLRIPLENHVASARDILEESRVRGNYYVLGSGESLLADRRFRPEAVSGLLSVLKQSIDVCLLDCGCDPDDPLTVGGLQASDHCVIVLTQNPACLRRWVLLRPFFTRLNVAVSCFAVNKSRAKAGGAGYLLEENLAYESIPVKRIEYSERGERAEKELRSLYALSRRSWGESIRQLCAMLEKEKEQQKGREIREGQEMRYE